MGRKSASLSDGREHQLSFVQIEDRWLARPAISIIWLGKAHKKYILSCMEGVIPWQYTAPLKQISDRSQTPILTGEDMYLKESFQVLCEKHGVG
jgi:L-alanine-DL-glutamate epimerase-like enolase superfamily enzyme